MSVSQRVSQELGDRGLSDAWCGYHIRLEKKTGPKTRFRSLRARKYVVLRLHCRKKGCPEDTTNQRRLKSSHSVKTVDRLNEICLKTPDISSYFELLAADNFVLLKYRWGVMSTSIARVCFLEI